MDERKRDLRPDVLICLLLAVGSFLLYLPSLSNLLIDWDDPEYVTANPVVQRGLTVEGVRWAFTTDKFANWLPVTWLSHMLDVELYGLDPAGHHATSAALHGVNAALLYCALLALTSTSPNPARGERLRAATVAVLFAVHPLRVESVAWVAERKDVLCATFFFLVLICYAGYCRYSGKKRGAAAALYVLAVVCHALGLMSKTMLVTVPFLLLLLDFWPLVRLRLGVRRLLVEKLPFLMLTVISSAWTIVFQREGGTMWAARRFTLAERAGNAVVSVPRYLAKTLWPTDLSPFYPHPGAWPAWQVAASAALVVAITAAVLWQLLRRPYLAVGWFWFLGMLVPVSGIVQVGLQAMADRYMYLPGIGLLIVAVWGVSEFVERLPRLRPAVAALAGIVIVTWSVLTWRQQKHWATTFDLFQHALSIDPDNWLAHNMVGLVRWANGDDAAAIRHYEIATRLNLHYPDLFHNYAVSLQRLGQLEQAITQYQRALDLKPDIPVTQLALAMALTDAGRFAEAEPHFREAVRLVPHSPLGYVRWGEALLAQGRSAEAAEKFKQALRLAPDDASAREALRRATGPAK
jgi:tetratricopeptide (TPR) repeat protein